jgi:hypothetical protein
VGPLLNLHELYDHRWGCTYGAATCPRLRQATTVTALSPQTSNANPIYWRPALENGGSLVLKGTLTQAATATLGTVTSKNRPSNQWLTTTFTVTSGSIAVNQILVNATHPSRAYVWASLGAGVFAVSQPLTAMVPPLTSPGVPISITSEVDTWTTGDSITAYTVPTLNVVSIEPTVADFDASRSAGAYVYNVDITHFDANPFGLGIRARFGDHTYLVESIADRAIGFLGGPLAFNGAFNVKANQSIYAQAELGGVTVLLGGGVTASTSGCDSCIFDDDFIFDGSNLYSVTSRNEGNIGVVYVGSGSTLHPRPGTLWLQAQLAGGPFVYGPGGITIPSQGHLRYPSGAGAAASAFLLSGGIKMLNVGGAAGTTACNHTGANPDVITCGITISPTNLDTAVTSGGFGGNAFIPGGGSITNF